MEHTLFLFGGAFAFSFWLIAHAQEAREKDGERMPKILAQIFGVVACAHLFYLVASIEQLFACDFRAGCEKQGVFWAGLQESLGAIPVTADLFFWLLLFVNGTFAVVMMLWEKRAQAI